MENHKQETASRQIRSITYLSIVANISLSIIKAGIGLFAGSLALLTDGIHSLSDVATDAAVLLGLRLGSKAPSPGAFRVVVGLCIIDGPSAGARPVVVPGEGRAARLRRGAVGDNSGWSSGGTLPLRAIG